MSYHCTGDLAGSGVDLEVSMGTVEPEHYVNGTLTADWLLTYKGATRLAVGGYYPAGSRLAVSADVHLSGAWNGILGGEGSKQQGQLQPYSYLALPSAVSSSALLSRTGYLTLESGTMELAFITPFGEPGATSTCQKVSQGTIGLTIGTGTNRPPVASFTHACDDTTISCTFNASGSSDPDGSVASYAWDFGDGATGTGARPSHTYASPGDYRVRLTVTDNKGAASSDTQDVTVSGNGGEDPPVADFQVSCDQVLRNCAFDASSSADPDGTITSYRWDFGDGGTADGVTASRIYAAAGTYLVSLIVEDDDHFTATATKQIALVGSGANQPPTARFEWMCLPVPGCKFDANPSTDPDGTIVSYTWEFGNGASSVDRVAYYKYPVPGTYTVKLTVIDDKGARAVTTQEVTMPAG
ncbi:PKD domain-containing protein [Nonomuraea jabiensis]|nr:PKD domain-containing protein [Nonomuraea jabiensis]